MGNPLTAVYARIMYSFFRFSIRLIYQESRGGGFSAGKHSKLLKVNKYAERIFNLMVIGINDETKHDYTLTANLGDCTLFIRPFLFREMIMGSGRWEPYIKNILDTELKETDVLVDVGANIGIYTVPFSKKVTKVIAFEPHPKTSEILEKSIRLNNIDNVLIVKKVVGSSKKKLQYALSTIPQESGIVANRPSISNIMAVIEMESIDLDSAVVGENKIDWLLIDVEGSEVDVLLGARKVLRRHSPKILCEVHSTDIKDEICRMLNTEGYSVTNIYLNYYYAKKNN